MNIARLLNYFLPVDSGPPLRDHRAEARACAEANRKAAAQLVQAERDYWDAYHAKAVTQVERDRALDQLNRLDCMERVS